MAEEKPEPPDLVDSQIGWFRRHPVWSRVIFAAGVAAVVLALWKNVTGETIGQSLMRLPALFSPSETFEDCWNQANSVTEKLACHRKYEAGSPD